MQIKLIREERLDVYGGSLRRLLFKYKNRSGGSDFRCEVGQCLSAVTSFEEKELKENKMEL